MKSRIALPRAAAGEFDAGAGGGRVAAGVDGEGGADDRELVAVGLDGRVAGRSQILDEGVAVGDVGGSSVAGGGGEEQQAEAVADAGGDQLPVAGDVDLGGGGSSQKRGGEKGAGEAAQGAPGRTRSLADNGGLRRPGGSVAARP